MHLGLYFCKLGVSWAWQRPGAYAVSLGSVPTIFQKVRTTYAPTSMVCDCPLRGLTAVPEEETDSGGQCGLHCLWGRLRGRGAASSLLSTFLPSGLIFYDTKVTVMNRVLNATVQRTADHAAPEITLDPLEIVGGETSYTYQKMQNSNAEMSELISHAKRSL